MVYDDSDGTESGGFWCHEESPLRRPVGWARKVGHQIAATPKYHDRLVEQVCHPLHLHCSYHQVPGGD